MPRTASDNEVLVSHLGWITHEPGDEVATLLRQGHFEAAEQAFFWLFLRDGDRFLDCGAHAGLYSILTARALGDSGRIVSMEPNPKTAVFLRANLAQNGASNAVVLEAAAWSKAGEVLFTAEQPGRAAYCHVVPGAATNSLSVKAMTLTEACREFEGEACTLAKIDTEGAEVEVLKGAAEAVAAGQFPLLMVEFNEQNLQSNGESTESLFAQLSSLGYWIGRFNPATLRLEAASFAGPIWYENLFAATDPKAVNHRLAESQEQRCRIAREILSRAGACNRLRELEELDNFKAKASEAEATRQWAMQTESYLAEARKLASENEAWARRAEESAHESQRLFSETKAWAEAAEKKLQAANELSAMHRDWALKAEERAAIGEQRATASEQRAASTEQRTLLAEENEKAYRRLVEQLGEHWWVRLGSKLHAMSRPTAELPERKPTTSKPI